MKQYNIKGIGTILHVLYFTMPLFSVGAYSMSAVTMYTVLLPYIKPVAPWLTAPIFFIFCAILCILLLIVVYTFVYRNYFDFQNSQQFPEDGPVMKAIRKAVREEIINAQKPH